MMENNSDSGCSDFEIFFRKFNAYQYYYDSIPMQRFSFFKYVNLTNFSRFTINCSSFDFKYGTATKNHISKDNSLIINEMLYASELYHLKIFVQIPINI